MHDPLFHSFVGHSAHRSRWHAIAPDHVWGTSRADARRPQKASPPPSAVMSVPLLGQGSPSGGSGLG